ncbi:MAG TPA: class I SAM-dependent methyltransferase [Polyangiaceae bacterium]|nr:class I SAM-dependent methyltransferase [Polyangiaceae bacterium]
MKPGTESQTAVMVAAARAAAHGRTAVTAFADPTALSLLPADARQRVEQHLAGVPPKGLRERLERKLLVGRVKMMVPRTVAIDAAIREAASPQLVILGAGLDGRAWRMPELANTTVFEVDHPDSQRRKRERVASLQLAARELRFVPVDFTRDRLEDALAAAGHDPTQATTWVWEGVVMYLERADIEATLGVVQARSAPGSQLAILYTSPSLVRAAAGFALGLIGEPFRSAFSAEQMRTLLAGFGFSVVHDHDLAYIATRLGTDSSRLFKDVRLMSAVLR